MRGSTQNSGGRLLWAAACGVLAAAALLLVASCVSHPPDAEAPELQLERIVLFSRHGVRPPTRAVVLPEGYTSAPWPVWAVEPGHLTPHGYRGAVHMGTWAREMLAVRGLFAGAACPEAGAMTVRTNTIHRTRETGRAFIEGFAPGCGIEISFAEGERSDPLFDAIDLGRTPFDPAAARAAVLARAGGDLALRVRAIRPAFDRLHEILGCCAPSVCEAANLAPGCAFGDLPHIWEDTPPNRRVRINGPFSLGGTAAQSILLEYVEGKPMQAVGWGRANAEDIGLLSEIHAVEFDLLSRTPYIARRAAAFILDHVIEHFTADAGPVLSLLVGHDTNIANIGGALDVHWSVPGYAADDQAVSGVIGFELLRDAAGVGYVRLFYAAPTALQLRTLEPLSNANPPHMEYLAQPLCGLPDDATLCTLEAFLRSTEAVIVRVER